MTPLSLKPEAHTLNSLGHASIPDSKIHILHVLSNENHGRYQLCLNSLSNVMEWMARVAKEKEGTPLKPPAFTHLEERILKGLQEDPTFQRQVQQLPCAGLIFELYGNRPSLQKEDLAYMPLALKRPKEIKRSERREYRQLVREKKASLPTQVMKNILRNPTHPYYLALLERLRYLSYAKKREKEDPAFRPSYVKLDYDLLGVGEADLSLELRQEIQELQGIAERRFPIEESRHRLSYFTYALEEEMSEEKKRKYLEKVEAGIAPSPHQCIIQAIFNPKHPFYTDLLERLIYRQYVKEKKEEDPDFVPSLLEIDKDLERIEEQLSADLSYRFQRLCLVVKDLFSLTQSRYRHDYFKYALQSSPWQKAIATYLEKVEAGIAPSPRQAILQALAEEKHPFRKSVIECLENKHTETVLSYDLRGFLQEPEFSQDFFYELFLHPVFYEQDPHLKQEMRQFLIQALTDPSHHLHSLCDNCLKSVVKEKGEEEKENDQFEVFDRDQPIPRLLYYFWDKDPLFSSELKKKGRLDLFS